MKKMLLVIVIFVSVFSSACMLMRVSQKGTDGIINKIPGIPFYCKVNKFYHITRYLQTVYLVSFQYKATNEKEWNIDTIKLPEENLIDIKNWFSDLSPIITDKEFLDSKIKEFRGKSIRCSNNSFPTKLVANLIETRMEVNTNNIYYLNQKIPLIGSSSLETELNPDGTLAKTKSTVEDQSLAKVIDFASAAFPFKEFFLKKLDLQKDEKNAKDNKAKKVVVNYEIKLIVTPKVYLYTLSEDFLNESKLIDKKRKEDEKGESSVNLEKETEPNPLTNIKLKFDDACNPVVENGVSFEMKEIKPDADKKDDKAEKKSIEISGSITLPDDKKK